jgi:hypothetical protein
MRIPVTVALLGALAASVNPAHALTSAQWNMLHHPRAAAGVIKEACVVTQVCQRCPIAGGGGTYSCNCYMMCLPGT